MYYCYLDTPIGELLLAGEDASHRTTLRRDGAGQRPAVDLPRGRGHSLQGEDRRLAAR